MSLLQLLSLRHKARAYYPSSPNCQRQWLRKSVYLYATGKHVLSGGAIDARKPTVLGVGNAR